MKTHEDSEHERIANVLRTRAASVPANPDPYSTVISRVHAARRRTALAVGSTAAIVVAMTVGVTALTAGPRSVLVGIGGAPSASAPRSKATGTNTPTTRPSAQPGAQWPMMFGPKPDTAVVTPIVDRIIARYGKPTTEAGRAELTSIVGAFQACTPTLDAYQFKALWVGDTASMSDGHGAAVVEVIHNGIPYQIVGFRDYKGNVLVGPVAVPPADATQLDIAALEFSDTTQHVYIAVWTTPGATVTVPATKQTPAARATADAHGLARLDLGNQTTASPWNAWWPSVPLTTTDASGHTRQVRKATTGSADVSILPTDSACRS